MKSTSCQVDASEGTVIHSHKKKQHIRMFGKTSAPLHCNSTINMQTKKWGKGKQNQKPSSPLQFICTLNSGLQKLKTNFCKVQDFL